MRTWVFYLSVYGRLFKAVVEKILHEKSTAYLTCSNAKKKALMEKCKWRGRLYMQGMFWWQSGTSLINNLDPLVDPDTDEFANLDNWSVIPVKNYHQHKHEIVMLKESNIIIPKMVSHYHGTRWYNLERLHRIGIFSLRSSWAYLV